MGFSFLQCMRLVLCSLTLLWSAQLAHAGLMLFPTRVVLEKNQRSAQVQLGNNGTTAETYRINLVNLRMDENGEFIAITTPGPGEQFSDALVRYSPRQVTIEPGGFQVVRIIVRKPADLAAGEYRSHLQFDRVADVEGVSSVEQAEKKAETGIGLKITALIGASIPLIVRHGDTQARATVSDLGLALPAAKDNRPVLTFQINRSGNRSLFGNLTVQFTPKGGQPLELAKMNGLAVYVPNPIRRVRLNLTLPSGAALGAGTLSLSFRESTDAGGRLIAEASLPLPCGVQAC